MIQSVRLDDPNTSGMDWISVFSQNEEEQRTLAHPFSFARAHFVAQKEGCTVGRISANRSPSQPKRGYFGFFDVDPDLGKETSLCAALLLESAESWLRAQGVEQVFGPVNYSTLFDYRVRLDSDLEARESPRFSWEPNQPESQLQWLHESGYQLHEEYRSTAFRDSGLVLPVSENRYREAMDSGFTVRPIRQDKEKSGILESDLRALFKINSKSFQESFLSEPFDLKAYQQLNIPRYEKLLSDLSFFIVSPGGEEIGYFFLFVDQGYLVWKTLAILPEYQKAGLAGFGIHYAIQTANARGISKVVTALIRKGAPSESLLEKAAPLRLWTHRYGVFNKSLLPSSL